MLFIKLNFIKIKSLKLLVLKDCQQIFASNINRNWAIQSLFSDDYWAEAKSGNDALKSLGNIDKKFLSRLADFGR